MQKTSTRYVHNDCLQQSLTTSEREKAYNYRNLTKTGNIISK